MEALLEDSETAEIRCVFICCVLFHCDLFQRHGICSEVGRDDRHSQALEVENAARLSLEKALERQAEATEQLDQR